MVGLDGLRGGELLGADEELCALDAVGGNHELLDAGDGDGDAEGDAAVVGDALAGQAVGLEGEVHLAGAAHVLVSHYGAHFAAGEHGALHSPAGGDAIGAGGSGSRAVAVDHHLEGADGIVAGGGSVGEGQLEAAGEVLEEQLAVSLGGEAGGHREDHIVARTVEVEGEATYHHSAGAAAIVDDADVVAAGGSAGGIDGVEVVRQVDIADIKVEAIVGGDAEGGAAEVYELTRDPSAAAVELRRVDPLLGAGCRHILREDAQPRNGGLVLAAGGKHRRHGHNHDYLVCLHILCFLNGEFN